MANKDPRHLSEFTMLRCAPDLLALRLYPNPKEITESMAAFDAVRQYVMKPAGFEYDDPDVAIVCVGDGCTPRTGALFAMRSNWSVISIDPALPDRVYPIKRLTLQRRKVEDEVLHLNLMRQVVIVQVHSHANLALSLAHIKAPRRHLITIPCCVPHEILNKPYIGYDDAGIWSPKRTVKIWMDI